MQNEKKCSCGHSIDDPMIVAKTRYTKKGYVLLSMGFSAKPTAVVFQCQQCGDLIGSSTDENVIEKYRYNSDIIK